MRLISMIDKLIPEDIRKRILFLSFEIVLSGEDKVANEALALYPSLGIALLKRYINDNTEYYARCFDPGIKITNDIFFNHSKRNELILDNFKTEKILDLDTKEFRKIMAKAREKPIDSIPDADRHLDKFILLYNFGILQKIIDESHIADYGCIGFSVLSESNLRYSLLLARMIRELYPEKKIIFGGLFFNDFAEGILDYGFIDFLVVGKGLVSMRKILDIINGKENGIAPDGKIIFFESGEKHILEASRENNYNNSLELLPDYDDFTIRDYTTFGHEAAFMSMFTSGCKYNCAYCAWNQFDKKIECADIEKVVDNMIAQKEKYGVKKFFIANSSINQNKDLLKQFCQALIEKDSPITYNALGNVDYIDAEVVSLLKRSGCGALFLGVESFDDSVLKNVHKPHRNKDIFNAIDLCIKGNLKFVICLISGLPGETEKEHAVTKEALSRIKLSDFVVYDFKLFAGSDIFKNPDKYGIKDILVIREAFKIPMEFGYTTEDKSWDKILEIKKSRADELRKIAKEMKKASR